MSKKFDIKRTLGNPTPPLSIEAVEEMTKLIHNKKETVTEPIVEKVAEKPIEVKKVEKIETPKKTTEPKSEPKATIVMETEKSRRGRKPNPIVETERLLRVSVDLPESVFIQLKILVIQQKTDMKTYIRKLVEKNLK